eukprot:Selendium_serpulae@DN4785_c0_g2_i1.p1
MPRETNAARKPSPSSHKVKAHPFVVTKWSGVALWSSVFNLENCGICKTHLTDKCIECVAKGSPDKCTISWGNCGHTFHSHCLSAWLTNHQICPLCLFKWELARTDEID